MKNRVSNLISIFKNDVPTKDLVSHNGKLFARQHEDIDGNAEILLEHNGLRGSHVAYSYLANVLSKRHSAKIKAYRPYLSSGVIRRLKIKVLQYLSVEYFGIYKSLGTSEFVLSGVTNTQRSEAKQIAENVYATLLNKADIENIIVDGIWLGDLIYDSYLGKFHKPTIQISNPNFAQFLLEAIELYIFWRDYFDSHNIKAVIVSHCVYLHAIPLRVAVSRGIDAFQINETHVYKLSADKLFAYTDHDEYHKDFLNLPAEIQKKGIEKAKERVELRFSGQVGVDMSYSTKSAYGKFKEQRLIRKSAKTKVFVATHCFFDSPHAFGNNLFPDFYEWLIFLGEQSEKTDNEWYIKTHPDFLPGTMEVINTFLLKYSKWTLLPADTSHHQIIAEGVDVALTCYGTIGFEYAALGIPTINASLNNPHIAYGFNCHPKSIEEYEKLLSNLDGLKLDINLTDVYEYYFMSRLHKSKNWLFNDYDQMVDDVGGSNGIASSAIYSSWLNDWDIKKHNIVINRLQQFLETNEFRLL